MGKKPYKDLYEDEGEVDSDIEGLQEAFAAGILKPGLNVEIKGHPKGLNKSKELRELADKITLNLPWIERLDIQSKPAPLAPELKLQIDEAVKKQTSFKNLTAGQRPPPIQFDDIKRESVFYRQAQDAVLSVLPKLKELKIATQRPEDYYAQMAKSDVHMQRVKLCMIHNKAKEQTLEKVRHQREQRKIQKAVTAKVRVQQEAEKRDFLRKLKRMRSGTNIDMTFLDTPDPNKKKSVKIYKSGKRLYKNKKYGMGGKKRGMKANTRESTFELPSRKDKKQHFTSLHKKRMGKDARQKLKLKTAKKSKKN